MFKVGDKVVYPLHGAGIIKTIEIKSVSEIQKSYYSLSIPFRKLEVLIPVDSCQMLGIREIIKKDKVREIMEVLATGDMKIEPNWNRRYRENMELLKTGDYLNVARVVRDLHILDQKKPLATGEKKMLNNSKFILASEISLATGEEEEEILIWIKEKVLCKIT